jgi:hypothetical protein
MSTFSIEIDARWINGLRQGDAAALVMAALGVISGTR